MITCRYKKIFLKDLSKVKPPYRKRIEKLVFDEMPKWQQPFGPLDIKKIRGYEHYYRIRIGDYRIGFKIENKNIIIFYRVKTRSAIYKLFP